MNTYHIGIRLRGFSKEFLKKEKAKTQNEEEKYIPHITLLRPFYAKNESELINKFEQTLQKYKDPIKFTINDFNYFNNDKKIIHAKINKNSKIEEIIHSFENNLEKIIQFKTQKIGKEINLHATISEENNASLIEKLDKQTLPIDQYLLRIYLLKHHKNPKEKLILREYDFYLNKCLTRQEAKDKELFKETINQFTKKTGLIPTSQGFIKK